MKIGVLKAIAGAIQDANFKQFGNPAVNASNGTEIPTVEIVGELKIRYNAPNLIAKKQSGSNSLGSFGASSISGSLGASDEGDDEFKRDFTESRWETLKFSHRVILRERDSESVADFGAASSLAQSTSSSMASLVGTGCPTKRRQNNSFQRDSADEDYAQMGHMEVRSQERPSNNSQTQRKAYFYFYYSFKFFLFIFSIENVSQIAV